jgi:glycosyltransferase involved in cell wall biosynthesis
MQSGIEPFVSIVVRSYKRPVELHQLLGRLQTQAYPRFEIVVCDQSDNAELVQMVRALDDPRINLLVRPPLGAPGARNEAIRHTTGDIIIMIDDDDLPIDNDWISAHVANYADPSCQGVSGRCVETVEQAARQESSRTAARNVLSLTFFRDGLWFAWQCQRKVGIDYLFGTNASFRRSLVERIGGWDEVSDLMWGEEQSFSLKFMLQRRKAEYFVFDPVAVAIRRTDVAGGCARRTGSGWVEREVSSRIIYFHRIVAHYFPLRFLLLYPVFLLWLLARFGIWVWDGDNRHMGVMSRVLATARGVVLFPWLVLRFGWLRPGLVRRVPKLF